MAQRLLNGLDDFDITDPDCVTYDRCVAEAQAHATLALAAAQIQQYVNASD